MAQENETLPACQPCVQARQLRFILCFHLWSVDSTEQINGPARDEYP